MDDKPIALDAYEALADRYNAKIETKPHNAYYERPAILSLLPGNKNLVFGCAVGVGIIDSTFPSIIGENG